MKFQPQMIYEWYRGLIRNPKYRWWVIGLSLAYLLSPLDISPDIFPIIGWIDDGIIVTLLVGEISQLISDRLKTGKSSNASEQPFDNPTNPTDVPAAEKTVDAKAVSVE